MVSKIACLEDAESLVIDIQNKISNNGILFLKTKSKNSRTLAALGITASRAIEIIGIINGRDYYSGPDRDNLYPAKTIWVFCMEYSGMSLYIKFSVSEDDSPVVCLSFHEAERPMKCRFKSS